MSDVSGNLGGGQKLDSLTAGDGNDVDQLDAQQTATIWSSDCGESHLKRVLGYRSLIEEVDELKMLNVPLTKAIGNLQAVVLELLPYSKQTRARAALEVGAVGFNKMSKHSWTILYDKDIATKVTMASILVRLFGSWNKWFGKNLKLKDILSK